MHNSSERFAKRPATVVLIALLLAAGIAVIATASAQAAQFKMVTCAGNTGPAPYATETSSSSLFQFGNYCGGQGGDPPGSSAFLRINETQASGNAAQGAYGRMVFATPAYVHFKAAGAYTREPNAFNAGWLTRFRIIDFSGNATTLLNQGQGLPNSGINYATTGVFAPHLWPFGGYMDFHHFYYELTCYLPGGCDRANYNAVDANAFVFILNDDQAPNLYFTGSESSPFLGGQWTRGPQWMSWYTHDNGSGLRNERIRVDGAQRYLIDHQALAQCNPTSSASNGEFARSYEPCPHGPYDHSWTLDTASLADGSHQLSVCVQDYGQYQGLNGTGGETCDNRTIRTDNTAPGKPASLEVTSANPARYLAHFGAQFSLPPNAGSPIAKVHYGVIDAEGNAVGPERVLSGTNPTEIAEVEGPAEAGEYRLRVWLEDSVGLVGPAATAPVPRDTVPPAAPQALRVAGPTTARWVGSFDLRWRNLADAGSPIDAAHYQVVDAAGDVVVPTRTFRGVGVQEIGDAQAPARRGEYEVRVWLSDEEGNVGAAASVPVPRDTTPPAAPQDVSVAPPAASRASEGFDLRWRNVADEGSPIDAAHYQVLSGAGAVVVPTTTVEERDIEAIAGMDAPRDRGAYTLRLWLSDAEGNVGAPVSVPLSYTCVRSEANGGAALTSTVAPGGRSRAVVRQGRGVALRGTLLGTGGAAVTGASLCVFARVATDSDSRFLGIALTGAGGRYRFAVPAGPSRELTVAYRSGHREVSVGARVATRVRPYFKVRRKVVRNQGFARFHGRIPGPHNDSVVVVLQVKRGKGWLAFRRYRTRRGGRFTVGYRFSRTKRPTLYVMRAQVRSQGGYPYLQGTSKPLRLIVLPAQRGRR